MNDSEFEAKRQEVLLDIVQRFRLFDDTFMSKIFEDTACVELLLRIILGKDDLTVQSVRTQHGLKNLLGHSVVLDIFAHDADNIYNIEVQRENKEASPKRARYNSALMDMNVLIKGEDYEKLPISYVIFITENDICGYEKGCGQPLYKIERTVTSLEGNPIFGDRSHIIYVNGEYRGNDAIGKLMEDFSQSDPHKMNYKVFEDRVSLFKETEEGKRTMCKLVDEYADKWKVEPAVHSAVKLRNKEIAENLWNEGIRDYDKISRLTSLPLSEVQKLFEGKTA